MSSPPPAQLSAMKLALLASDARAQYATLLRAEPIAIIGMSCRFPGKANSPEEFWQLLRNGVDAVVEIPPTRWDVAKVYDPDPAARGKTTVRHAGLLEEIDGFDAAFFGILPREAERMDPQQRIFMEVATDALDRSGLARETLSGSRTGVYVASYHNDYAQLQYADREWIDSRTLTGTLHSVVPNRLSYHLDLRGPSVSLDSACSSSLVAVHLACQGLRSGETDLAIAGGVSILASPELMISLAKVGFTSVAGRCRTFDAAADGFVRGEGCGVVVLKRLSDAVAAGDRILSVIRSSVVNQDGHTTVMAAPNGLAQRALIREALEIAGISPARVGLLEAHGTGTPLGDPIEVEALAETVGPARPDGAVCYLGAAKANIGHLEAAAGVAGLIKATLALQHEEIPPQINFSRLNPHLLLDGTCLRVPTAIERWESGSVPRVAGISSFGAGGTNAHVLIEEAPRLTAEPSDETRGPFLLPLSAQSPTALEALAARWIQALDTVTTSAGILCASAGAKRSHYDYRLAVVGESAGELRDKLRAYVDGREVAGLVRGNKVLGRPRIGFAFSGQGSQWAGMGRELLVREPLFRDTMGRIDAEVAALTSWSLLDALESPAESSRLDETEVAQPAIFAMQVALCALLESWGISPDAVIGHSIGELAALHVAGVLALKEAVRLVVLRAKAMQRATGLGAMATVALDESQAQQAISGYGARLSVAALNAPRGTVLSGERDALTEVLAALDARGIAHRMLPVNYAFHSGQVAPLAADFRRSIDAVRSAPADVPVYSTVTGARLGTEHVDAAYLERNVRDPVRFAPAVNAMLEDGIHVWLEIGPHAVLSFSIAECAAAAGQEIVLAATLRREKPERAALLTACAAVYANARRLDWEAVNHAAAEPLELPAYPWEHARFWLREKPSSDAVPAHVPDAIEAGGHELLGRRIELHDGPVFSLAWPRRAPAWLADHRVGARIVVPAAAMLESFRAAASRLLGTVQTSIDDFLIREPLVLSEEPDAETEWQIASRTDADARRALSIHARSGNAPWRLIASCNAGRASAPAPVVALSGDEIAAVEPDSLYSWFGRMGMSFGPGFRTAGRIRLSSGGGAEVWLSSAIPQVAAEGVHTVLLDGALQACVAAAAGPSKAGDAIGHAQLLLPIAVDHYATFAPAPSRLHARVVITRETAQSIEASIDMYAPDGTLCASVQGARFARASASDIAFASAVDPWLYTVEWREVPSATPAMPIARLPGGRWVVFAEQGAAFDALAVRLGARGAEVVRVVPGSAFQRLGAGRFAIDPFNPEDFDRLIAELCTSAPGALHFAHLWSLDPAASRQSTAAQRDASDGMTHASALHLVQAALRAPAAIGRLVFVTRGAQDAGGVVTHPSAAGIWGLIRGAGSEFPELALRVIDLDQDSHDDFADVLSEELLLADAPRMVSMRNGRRLAPRLARLSPARDAGDRRLVSQGGGTLDALQWRAEHAAPPGPAEVVIRVHATGLNFRDVLLALGAYPGGEHIPLGVECAGTVESVGSAVATCRPGDAVFGFAPASLATRVTLPAAFVARIPQSLSMEQAAALPAAYLTVIYGLERLAGLRRGMRILIHAATGGVGLAAVHWARMIGAELYITAGSETKRALLRSMGINHVFDSRSLEFAAQIRDVTRGAGVDVVLNSLSGDFIAASFSALAQGGFFLELGKRDIWTAEQAASVRPDARYRAYDLGAEILADHGLAQTLMATLVSRLESREIPPLPVRVFAMDAAAAAFRFMAQARHVGKLVLKAPQDPSARDERRALVRPESTYLVTGGLGGIGVRTARWLAESGARCIVLTGRTDPGADARRIIGVCTAAGAVVHVRQADAGDETQMRAVFDEIARDMPPLRGIVHAAGALDDGLLPQQSWARWQRVLRGKAHGARILHRMSEGLPLDFFVLYSAAGLLLGPSGQSAYAAANAELDALAQQRRAAGLPALSVGWGQWAEAGMAVATATAGGDRWQTLGLQWILPGEGFSRLEQLLRRELAYAAVLPIDWRRFASASNLPEWERDFLGELVRPPAANGTMATARPRSPATLGIVEQWRATPQSRRRERMLETLRVQVLEVLGLPETQVLDARSALKEAGLDSLMAVEYRNVLSRLIGRQLPATLLFDYPSLDVLATHLMRLLELGSAADGTTAPVSPAAATQSARSATIESAVASLSDREAEAALLAELDQPILSSVT